MGHLSRREWADLRVAHPCDDLENPTDDFAQALIAATGGDPDAWETGGTQDALTAYRVALAARPDFDWATSLLERAPEIAVEVSTCLDAGIPYDDFLSWSPLSQDLALALLVRRADTCPAGHPRDAMQDADLMQIKRVHCAVCARVQELNKRIETEGTDDHKVGWHTEVTRVSG